MIKRRSAIRMAVYCIASGVIPLRRGLAQDSPLDRFDREFKAYSDDADTIELAHQFRELWARDQAITESQTGMEGKKSTSTIHDRAIQLIIASEISSEQVYESKYKSPIWPKGDSGITIGIGYDLGYVKAAGFQRHWADLLNQEAIDTLKPACGLKAKAAAVALESFSSIKVDWDDARAQFDRYLPYIIAETERAFPGADKLPQMCLGALTSLVYNRGSDTSPSRPRRVHMHEIKLLVPDSTKWHLVPGRIRAMQDLWKNNRDMAGLIKRRELEATLFEAGLK